jgi:hypothetical protein
MTGHKEIMFQYETPNYFYEELLVWECDFNKYILKNYHFEIAIF